MSGVMVDDAVRRTFKAITGRAPDSGPEGLTWLAEVMAGRTGQIRSRGDRFFVKWSGTPEGRRALEAEADGLRRLHDACPDHVVGLVGAGRSENTPGALLVLEFVDRGTAADDFDDQLARALGMLHSTTAAEYGLERDNFIGATPQVNERRSTWPEFFAEVRLGALAERLQDRGEWPRHWSDPFDRLLERLPELLPERPAASLLHGDLWSGNVMTCADGRPVLIDPAVYHGHSETDPAMMKLFGGFGRRVFDRYSEIAGLESGFEERAGIYNLYHLLNHVLLFGAGYHGGVEQTLRRFQA